MKITKNSLGFVIEFKFNRRTLDAVKGIPGRRFDYSSKAWTVPIENAADVELFAKKHKVKIIDLEEISARILEVPPMPYLEQPVNLLSPMFPYQEQGVAYNLIHKRVIVGDVPGLGKTVQSIATIVAAQERGEEAYPCLVVCPSTLKINWQREWKMWADERAVILDNDNKNRWPTILSLGRARVFIVNYESLKKFFVESIDDVHFLTLKNIHFQKSIGFFNSIIVDESHRCKSFRTLQTKLVKGIAAGKNYRLALTGTPVVNSPEDLMPQIGIIDQFDKFGGYSEFKKRYVDIASREMHEELSALLRTHCFYRREKHDVLKDLPSKQRQMILCDITTRKEYEEAEADVIEYLAKWKNATSEELERAARGEIMVQIGNLKKISARGKLNYLFEFVDEVVEAGEKIIVFAHHHEILDQIIDRYKGKCVTITGHDALDERQISVDRFQNDTSVQVAICGIQAAGVGITLTASSRVAFIELAWHPAHHEQCEDRAHRIGQKDSVQCTYFIGSNTYDENIYSIIKSKMEMSNRITGAVDNVAESMTNANSAGVFEELLEQLNNGTTRIHADGSEDALFPKSLF